MVATTTEEVLRRLALEDETVMLSALEPHPDSQAPWLHQQAQAIARLSALIALGATVVSYQSAVLEALTAGVTADEIVGALFAVAPLVGRTRITSAAPAIALAMGYDVARAFEHLDDPDT